ncbi:MAG: protein kinase, partial [Pseudomonadota bacterium]
MTSDQLPEEIAFNRPNKFKTVDILGHGACGQTVHIQDQDMGIDLVAKKYSPIVSKEENPELFGELMSRFRDEARILFQLNHPNVVRVYNFFDYTDLDTSYIIMEHISGENIADYITNNPLQFDNVF